MIGCNSIVLDIQSVAPNEHLEERIQWLYNKTNFFWLYGYHARIISFSEMEEPIGDINSFDDPPISIETRLRYKHTMRFTVTTSPYAQVFVDYIHTGWLGELFETSHIWRLENFNIDNFCIPYVRKLKHLL